ncbi:MAG: hypothetical protein JW704_09970 [Anaerolineaceae bacterium]|nr:hypothetical protein [Anaerolineaceae bacterium]
MWHNQAILCLFSHIWWYPEFYRKVKLHGFKRLELNENGKEVIEAESDFQFNDIPYQIQMEDTPSGKRMRVLRLRLFKGVSDHYGFVKEDLSGEEQPDFGIVTQDKFRGDVDKMVQERRAQEFSSMLEPRSIQVYMDLLSKMEAEGAEFVTFQLKDRCEGVQVAPDDNRFLINYATYPHDEDPIQRIVQRGGFLPRGCDLLCWEPESYVTFAIPKCEHQTVAHLVDALFVLLFEVESDYEVDGRLE